MSNYVSLGHNRVFSALREFYRGLTDDRSREIFWRTLCIDVDFSEGALVTDQKTPAPAEYGDQFRVMFGIQVWSDGIPEDFMPGEDPLQRYRYFVAPFGRGLNEALINRTFITTRNEEFYRMGIGPYLAKEGNVVVVLFGANLCVVLRPIEGQDRYTLVGDAYIQGIMNGELVKDVSADGGQAFDIA